MRSSLGNFLPSCLDVGNIIKMHIRCSSSFSYPGRNCRLSRPIEQML